MSVLMNREKTAMELYGHSFQIFVGKQNNFWSYWRQDPFNVRFFGRRPVLRRFAIQNPDLYDRILQLVIKHEAIPFKMAFADILRESKEILDVKLFEAFKIMCEYKDLWPVNDTFYLFR